MQCWSTFTMVGLIVPFFLGPWSSPIRIKSNGIFCQWRKFCKIIFSFLTATFGIQILLINQFYCMHHQPRKSDNEKEYMLEKRNLSSIEGSSKLCSIALFWDHTLQLKNFYIPNQSQHFQIDCFYNVKRKTT